MDEMRVTSLELHQKLGQTIDRARLEPVTVTRHDRDHVVILSAEAYAALRQAARTARLTESLTAGERELAAAATVPSDIDQKRYLTQLAGRAALKAYECMLDARHAGEPDPMADAPADTEDAIEAEAVRLSGR